MITKTYTANVHLEHTIFQDLDKSSLLFFDIETTGLSPRSSSLYLIGAASFRDSAWTVTQWFAENPGEEPDVLDAFFSFCAGFSQIIHFNGNRFDLPYIAEKCRAYRKRNPLETLLSRDLYCMARPLKPLLGLSSLKQKSLEEFLGIFREDRFSGGELISVYESYVMSPSEETLQVLLLHNREDMLGMLSILPVLSYLPVISGDYRVSHAETAGDSLIIHAWLPLMLPQPFAHRGSLFSLTGSQNRLSIQIDGVRKPLKHFFADYKNYYYLPLEDTAIHKSVAAYVAKEYREPAKASNCYSKKPGFYLPQLAELFHPVFREEYKDRLSYFPCTDEFVHNRDSLQVYASHFLDTIR